MLKVDCESRVVLLTSTLPVVETFALAIHITLPSSNTFDSRVEGATSIPIADKMISSLNVIALAMSSEILLHSSRDPDIKEPIDD